MTTSSKNLPRQYDDGVKKEFGIRVRTARDQQRMTQSELAELCGVRRTFISGIEAGRQRPGDRTVRDLASALSVSISWLYGGDEGADEVNSGVDPEVIQSQIEEEQLLQEFRTLPPRVRRTMLDLIRAIPRRMSDSTQNESLQKPELKIVPQIPVSNDKTEEFRYVQFIDAAAGDPLDSEVQIEGVAVPSRFVLEPSGVVRAVGDSMSPIGITDGDIVVGRSVVENKNYHTGDVVVARIGDSEYVIKTNAGCHGGKRFLLSENPEYQPVITGTKESVVELVVVARRSKDGVWFPVEKQPVKNRLPRA